MGVNCARSVRPAFRSWCAVAFVFSIIFPVFGLVLAGYSCRRLGVLGPASATELNRFVVWLALPALLFQIMAKADWSTLYQPGFTHPITHNSNQLPSELQTLNKDSDITQPQPKRFSTWLPIALSG